MAANAPLRYMSLTPEQKLQFLFEGQVSSQGTMSLENPAPPLAAPPSSQSGTSSDTERRNVLDQVSRLDDWLAANPPPPVETKTDTKTSPLTKRQAVTANVNEKAQPVPVAIGARSSKNIILLNEKFQALAIERPQFTFTGSSEQGWSVKTDFLGQTLEEARPFNSKQEAKEALSGKALEVIAILEAEGKLRKPEKTKKKKVVGGGEQDGAHAEEKEPFVNYIGQLLEFQRSTGSPEPTYTDYALGQQFSCTLTIESSSSSPSDPLQTFGSTTQLFSSKKLARHNAAKCAVEHFKAAGVWPDSSTDVGGIKKKKAAHPQTMSMFSPTDSKSIASSPGGASYAEGVATLALSLGLSLPEWRYTPSDVPNFHTVSCYFKNGGPHEGPLGEVRHIYGKKKAKEECAKLVLEYLLEVKQRRLSDGKKMMELVGKGECVVGVAAKQQYDDEMGDYMSVDDVDEDVDRDMDEDMDEEEDDFKDAQEDFGKGDI